MFRCGKIVCLMCVKFGMCLVYMFVWVFSMCVVCVVLSCFGIGLKV